MTRVRVALAVVIVTALMPAATVYWSVVSTPAILGGRDDPITVFERRLAPVREALRGEVRIGYLGPPQGVERDAHLYTARYLLAPIAVFDDLDQPIILADGLVDMRRIPPHLRVRRDFGDGVFLLEPAPQ